MRRPSLMFLAAVLLVGGCAGGARVATAPSSEPAATSANLSAATTVAVSTTVVVTTTVVDAKTVGDTMPSATTLPAVSTSVRGSISGSVATTIVSPTTSVSTNTSTTSLASAVGVRPQLVLSQSSGLDPSGTLITVRGTGFDESKGVYLFVCNQATWTATRRCIGGINLDGSSPLSQWISSNPPGYAKGLTIPYESNGSFSVPLLVRATDDATNLINCSMEQCGVVAFADHTRRDDRSQDVFVPISFRNRP